MKKELELKATYPNLYNILGIYIDWQIDNNLISDPHGINSFEDFLGRNVWQVVEITFKGQKMLSMDITLPHYKLLKTLHIKADRILENELSGMEVEAKMKKYAIELNLPCFDVDNYYITNCPWDLAGKSNISSPDMITVNGVLFNKRIIIKVMNDEGYERIISVNDVYNGGVDDHECLVDATCYDEDTSVEMEKYWSGKLGIPVLGGDEGIDIYYKYQKD